MEPVTHLLTGACLARTGFHRRVAYATAAMTVAAEFPDIDTVWSLRVSCCWGSFCGIGGVYEAMPTQVPGLHGKTGPLCAGARFTA